MIKLLFITFSIAMCLVNTAHAEVYRSVDESGNIIFTDKPHKNSEKVDLPGLTTYESPPYKEIKAEKIKKPITKFTSYSEFKILSPASKDTIRNADGDVAVNLLVTPELQVKLGHRIVLYVDGSKVTSTTVTRYKLTNVDRGSHTLSAQIVDSNGKPYSELISTVFYLALVDDASKEDTQTGYDPDYDPKISPDYKSKSSPGYESKPSPGYKPAPAPNYKSKPSPGYKPKASPGYKP
ncbi:MAG: DUF4124 domain-containing protein [Gammaproteobacteria bacterium]|nr:DUF4124 domain-containing protein [Gammaproteobacteria bacterium]